jgi:hypothetical protein
MDERAQDSPDLTNVQSSLDRGHRKVSASIGGHQRYRMFHLYPTWAVDDLVWWSRTDVAYQWVGHIKKLAPLQDGTVLGELHSPSGSGRPQTDARFDVHLVLSDDPSPYASPLVGRLEQLHQSLTHWVIPRIFMVAEGRPPPIMISFSPPT